MIILFPVHPICEEENEKRYLRDVKRLVRRNRMW